MGSPAGMPLRAAPPAAIGPQAISAAHGNHPSTIEITVARAGQRPGATGLD
jgi:hypothetical protein